MLIRTGRSRTLLLAVLAVVVMSTLIEGLARLASTVMHDVAAARQANESDWLAYLPSLGWERKPRFKGWAGGGEREFDAAGYFAVDSAQVADRKGHKRVVFVGDSNTFGFGATTADSFVEVVERRLPGVDSINLGVIGYTSYQGRLALAQQLPRLKPDLVVVSFNFNDRRYVLRQEARDSKQEFERTFTARESVTSRVNGALEYIYTYRALRGLLQSIGALQAGAGVVDATQVVPRVDPDSYRRNLTEMVADAKALQIPVMFVVLRDNPVQSALLRQGVENLQKRDLDAAIEDLQLAVDGPAMFSDLARAYLARAYTERGDATRAADVRRVRSVYESFSGGRVIRLDTEYNNIMRAVGTETGAEVIEGADVVEKRAADFIDYCHFNAAGHRRLGDLIAKKIAARLGL